MHLKITWSNGAQTNFNVYDTYNGKEEQIAVMTQHADLYCYVTTPDQVITEGKHMMEGLEKLQAKIKAEKLVEIVELRDRGSLPLATAYFRRYVEPELRLDLAVAKVKAL